MILLTSTLMLLIAAARPTAGTGDTLRVLFLGNSYTYFNNLPGIFARLASARGEPAVTEMYAPGGWRLEDHWTRGDGKQALESSRLDYVVLQDQSTLGVNYYLDGRTRIAGDELFRPYAEKWVAAVKSAGAKPVLYLTWSRKQTPEDQPLLTQAYVSAAKATGALVAPVGIAWATIRERHPEIELYYRDGSHPSPAGSYLAAVTLFATIFDRSPVGLPAKVVGVPVNLKTEKPEPGNQAVLVDLPADQAAALQQAAWESHQRFPNGGLTDPPQAKPAELGPLPTGVALDPARIRGTWSGEITFYPVGPVSMQLAIGACRTTCEGRLELHYRSKDFRDESIALRDLRVTGGRITFSDSASVGVDSLPVRFQGVATETGELVGSAQTIVDDPRRRLKVLGSWKLHRGPKAP
jgi:hypothetical protein